MADTTDGALTTMPLAAPAPPTQMASDALAAAKAYARQALAPETLRAYATDWAAFTAWCRAAGCAPVPAEPAAVAAYLAACAPGYSRAALERRLAAIGHQHRLRDLPWSAGHPALRTTLRGIFRQHGSFKRQAAALTSAEQRRRQDKGSVRLKPRGHVCDDFA
jgi:hypothetical protein